MRCRPGDLAVIVGIDPCESGLDLGKLVRIVKRGDDWSDIGDTRWYWECDTLGQCIVEAQTLDGRIEPSDGEVNIDIADCHLRPIRDPGDDAVDETLAWKPVPLPVIQPELLPEVVR